MTCSALLLSASLGLAGAPLADDAPVHLGLTLQVTHADALQGLLRAQQDPASPDYRRWLTPAEYGARFGQPETSYSAAAAWLRGQGFEVTEYPNHIYVEGYGTAAQVAKLLGVHLLHVAGQPGGVHVPDGEPQLPKRFSSMLVYLSGLDTRVRTHHRLAESGGFAPALGPQDVRRFYDLAPLLDAGYTGQRQQLAVLGEAEPPASAISAPAIQYFLSNVSDARAQFIQDVMANPQQDVDPGGGNEEFQPDVELQSVGAPGAVSITLVESPASEVFAAGANEIVSNLPQTTAVSVSLGLCEEEVYPNEVTALEGYIQLGTLEGQTWSAATGDNGSDDCMDGATESIDFPASLPEIVAMGGSQINSPAFDANDAITAYQQEVVWSVAATFMGPGAAGGGGLSTLFTTPSYQTALGVASRSVPDLVLLAGNPGVAADSSNPFIGVPMAGQLISFEGTSAASPLSAGFFALIASRIGCRLGDPHAALYGMGFGQFDGGSAVYHDITSGSVSLDGVAGPSAAVGYDSASGWGSFNVAAMAAAWPPCPPPDAGYGFDGGVLPEASYDQCAFIGCDAGTGCVTLPEGPSSCEVACSAAAPCAAGDLCTPDTIYASSSVCVPGCATDTDCLGDAGLVCNACEEACVTPGSADAGVGIACAGPSDCATSSLCLQQDMLGNTWPEGYCTTFCDPSFTLAACSCPMGTYCSPGNAICLESCAVPGHGCRPGYACQPNGDGTASCQVPCQVESFGTQSFDSCEISSPTGQTTWLACDLDSGICGGPQPLPDAGSATNTSSSTGTGSTSGSTGTTTGGLTSGTTGTTTGSSSSSSGTTTGATPDAGGGGSKGGGCGCTSGGGTSELALVLSALAILGRRKRRGRGAWALLAAALLGSACSGSNETTTAAIGASTATAASSSASSGSSTGSSAASSSSSGTTGGSTSSSSTSGSSSSGADGCIGTAAATLSDASGSNVTVMPFSGYQPAYIAFPGSSEVIEEVFSASDDEQIQVTFDALPTAVGQTFALTAGTLGSGQASLTYSQAVQSIGQSWTSTSGTLTVTAVSSCFLSFTFGQAAMAPTQSSSDAGSTGGATGTFTLDGSMSNALLDCGTVNATFAGDAGTWTMAALAGTSPIVGNSGNFQLYGTVNAFGQPERAVFLAATASIVAGQTYDLATQVSAYYAQADSALDALDECWVATGGTLAVTSPQACELDLTISGATMVPGAVMVGGSMYCTSSNLGTGAFTMGATVTGAGLSQ